MRLFAAVKLHALAMPLLASSFIIAVYNSAFWHRFVQATGGPGWAGVPILAGTFVALALSFSTILHLLNFRYILKPLLAVLFIMTAVASHFMDHYGTSIDWLMVQSVIDTDRREASELVTLKLLLHVVLLGLLPAMLLGRLELQHARAPRQGLANLFAAGVSLALAILTILLLFKSLAPVLREHRDLRFLLTPTNYIHAINGYLRNRWESPVTVAPLGTDAHKGMLWSRGARRTVTVIVVGETARAANFSLNGYARDTNPQLARQQGLLNFSNMESCGTATAVSVPCLFSHLGRQGYSAARARSQEGLLDVLRHAGFGVLWRNNNSGCKGVCDRVDYEDLSRPDGISTQCSGDECFDGRMLEGLQQKIKSARTDMIIVLHQKGSHGPAYWKRYPAAFGAFGPVCKTSSLSKCSRESIVAAYDNSILYTDSFLSQTIDLLRQAGQESELDTAFMYVSDHGESLGEGNIYLHGAPFLISPAAQRQVPFMLWLSEGFKARFSIDEQCLRARAKNMLSHDHIFHSTLGMHSIRTHVYNPLLDIFHGCKPADKGALSGLR